MVAPSQDLSLVRANALLAPTRNGSLAKQSDHTRALSPLLSVSRLLRSISYFGFPYFAKRSDMRAMVKPLDLSRGPLRQQSLAKRAAHCFVAMQRENSSTRVMLEQVSEEAKQPQPPTAALSLSSLPEPSAVPRLSPTPETFEYSDSDEDDGSTRVIQEAEASNASSQEVYAWEKGDPDDLIPLPQGFVLDVCTRREYGLHALVQPYFICVHHVEDASSACDTDCGNDSPVAQNSNGSSASTDNSHSHSHNHGDTHSPQSRPVRGSASFETSRLDVLPTVAEAPTVPAGEQADAPVGGAPSPQPLPLSGDRLPVSTLAVGAALAGVGASLACL